MMTDTILTRCPLLLHLWSYERFVIVQQQIDLSAYENALYQGTEEDKPNIVPLDRSMGKYHCCCLVILQFNFKFITVITCPCT
jgi:hypothetical protein